MEEKHALVFGGTGGIGRELSRLLRENGYYVTVTGRSQCPFADETILVQADSVISQTVQDGAVGGRLGEALSRADVLCVSYGPFVQKAFHETRPADWQLVSLHDYALPGMLVSAALPGMMERRFGRIVLFGGTRTDSIRAFRTNAAYAGAKTGLSVLVRSVASCYAGYNITCSAVIPGYVTSVPQGAAPVSALEVAREALDLIMSDRSGELVCVS